MELSTIVNFSKLVADSPTSESVSEVLAQTIVERCGAVHAWIFGVGGSGEFSVLSSFGGCAIDPYDFELNGVGSIPELRTAVVKVCSIHGYEFRLFPLISSSALFGAVGIVYTEAKAPRTEDWPLIEGLTELTAISLDKAYQHQKLQQAFDDLRASQETLIRTEKFRALGEVTAGIAHDMRNLLNPVQLYTDLLREAIGNPDEILDIAERLERVVVRGLETMERLRNFSRLSPEGALCVPTDLDAMVREAVEISRPKLAETQLSLELGGPASAMLRPADCVNAIVNLLFNAVDAVEGQGAVTVRTGCSGDNVWIEVCDNGPGIPPEIRDKIVEPLFTTKGKGTGLGVSIVFAYTQKHGGRLDIESEPGRGATFRMSFPAILQPASTVEAPLS